ncbi:4'-phosphopantetheinyl transferase superfamily protein [Flavobacterium sp.]|uniref:4'-phosphopantetheinyl transferase family protein n=1 Tax=Flavobacterium sp. TaxID=239 RepID=UPI002C4C137C|nr:4'-phosphopantetheinyl transferase superfamily protein [Flavobacterium sp.]HSD05656.1 4'-phosphopantetheinyl transferase superfamily protein [Flavobacterium sp.]
MIGNDIVDLNLARKESNWRRKGFLEKIFSIREQELIHKSQDPEIMIWNLWTRKEAAYKIYNRLTGINGYFPWMLECLYEDESSGKVTIEDFKFHTQTQITNGYIYSEAVFELADFLKIKSLQTLDNVKKNNRIPYFLDNDNIIRPVSITHHGDFHRIILL